MLDSMAKMHASPTIIAQRSAHLWRPATNARIAKRLGRATIRLAALVLLAPDSFKRPTRGAFISVASGFERHELQKSPNGVSLSLGQQGKVLFYVTDPQCPYCKKGVESLQKMAAAGEIQVHFLLFPLESHKGAREQSVSTICDKKSLHDFENGYRSNNLCADGERKIDTARDLLSRKGITGTPAYIFPDRRFHTGLLEEAELRRRLGVTAAGAAPKPPAKKSP